MQADILDSGGGADGSIVIFSDIETAFHANNGIGTVIMILGL